MEHGQDRAKEVNNRLLLFNFLTFRQFAFAVNIWSLPNGHEANII